MRTVAFLALALLVVTCGPDPNAQLPLALRTEGGGGGTTEPGTGGMSGSGGRTAAGSGGRTTAGTGGTIATGSGGRVVGSGGRGSGGQIGAGGETAGSGGRTAGSGGRTTADAAPDARVNRDAAGPDLRAGSGGRTGTGGGFGRDGGIDGGGPGGITGSGGATLPRDAPARDTTSSSCYAILIDHGYACGTAPPCSACEVNNESKEAQCQKGIDCLAAAGPSCDSNCKLNCLNQAGDAQIQACINALTTVACGAGC